MPTGTSSSGAEDCKPTASSFFAGKPRSNRSVGARLARDKGDSGPSDTARCTHCEQARRPRDRFFSDTPHHRSSRASLAQIRWSEACPRRRRRIPSDTARCTHREQDRLPQGSIFFRYTASSFFPGKLRSDPLERGLPAKKATHSIRHSEVYSSRTSSAPTVIDIFQTHRIIVLRGQASLQQPLRSALWERGLPAISRTSACGQRWSFRQVM